VKVNKSQEYRVVQRLLKSLVVQTSWICFKVYIYPRVRTPTHLLYGISHTQTPCVSRQNHRHLFYLG
jgi:hypothetical protein